MLEDNRCDARQLIVHCTGGDSQNCNSRASRLLWPSSFRCGRIPRRGNVHLLAVTRITIVSRCRINILWGKSMNRMQRKKLSLAIVNALNAGVVVGLAVPMAYAQQSPMPAVSEVAKSLQPEKLEKIEVTGSRIPSPTLTSDSPVNVISAQDIRYTGLTNDGGHPERSCRRRPPDQGSNLSNGATGTATINLRDLGAARTLVLIDGKRVPAGSPTVWRDRHQRDPGAADPARRSADRRRVVDLRLGCRRGRGELHHERPLRGRPVRLERQRLQPPAAQLRRRHRRGRASRPTRVSSRCRATSASTARPRASRMTMGSNFANGKGNATVFFELAAARPGAAVQPRFQRVLARRWQDGLHLRRLSHQLSGALRRLHQLHLRPHDRQRRR